MKLNDKLIEAVYHNNHNKAIKYLKNGASISYDNDEAILGTITTGNLEMFKTILHYGGLDRIIQNKTIVCHMCNCDRCDFLKCVIQYIDINQYKYTTSYKTLIELSLQK